MNLRLVSNGSDNVITPLGIPSYEDLVPGTRSAESVIFEVEIAREPVDRLSVKISGKGGVLLQRELDASMRAVGVHRWAWSGFDARGILDTKVLKSSLTVTVSCVRRGIGQDRSLTLTGVAGGPSWIDATVDSGRKTVEVELRVNIKDGGEKGVGELPPEDVQKQPTFTRRAPVERRAHVRARSFVALQLDALASLRRHWSRAIAEASGVYQVHVSATATATQAMDDIAIVYSTNRDFVRSSNPGSVRGFYSFFGNVVPERIAYNVGWIRYPWGWEYVYPVDADQEFSETAAHEIGHEILSAYGGDSYSYGHRGSSTVLTQKPNPVGRGAEIYPATGEIDLMKYYHGSRAVGYVSRVVASEQDVRGFLHLARVRMVP